jgi:hypothetical protein
MRNANKKIVTIVIGLAGLVATGEAVAWTSTTPGQTPARVTHLAGEEEDMHWITDPGVLPVPVAPIVDDLVPVIPPESGDDMHW